jgi:hypothetical protein
VAAREPEKGPLPRGIVAAGILGYGALMGLCTYNGYSDGGFSDTGGVVILVGMWLSWVVVALALAAYKVKRGAVTAGTVAGKSLGMLFEAILDELFGGGGFSGGGGSSGGGGASGKF